MFNMYFCVRSTSAKEIKQMTTIVCVSFHPSAPTTGIGSEICQNVNCSPVSSCIMDVDIVSGTNNTSLDLEWQTCVEKANKQGVRDISLM